jgi:hypothetical protein
MDPMTMMMLMQTAMMGGKMLTGGKGGGAGAPPGIPPKAPTPFQQPQFNLMGGGAPPMQIPSQAPGMGGADPRMAMMMQLLQQGRA